MNHNRGMDARFILLVEDNPSEIALTRRAFERNRVTIPLTVQEDGQDAIDFLAHTDVLPVLVLLDLKLPRVDGLEVLRHIRANAKTRRIPVVILSSSSEAGDLERCYDAGVNSYVRKSVDFADFEKTIDTLTRYWTEANHPPPLSP